LDWGLSQRLRVILKREFAVVVAVVEESEEDVVDLRVDVLGEGLVEDGDEGLLDTRGTFG
jgi:hypothetical protein